MKEKYQEIYDKWLKTIHRSKDNNEQKELIDNAIHQLINVGGKDYQAYSRFVENTEYRFCSLLREIFIEERKYHHKYILEERKSLDNLLLEDEKRNVGIVFCNSNDVGYYSKKQMDNEYQLDKLIIVETIAPNDKAKEILIDEVNKYNQKWNVQIEYMTLQDFWIQEFSKEEYHRLLEMIASFNEETQKISGFYTVLMPNEDNLTCFREKIKKELASYPYLKDLEESKINHDEFVKIYNNYLNEKRIDLMLGNENYAISFVTSEWFYKIYQLTESLDLTNIVCGYLKSIEQLIWWIIEQNKEEGITIRSKEKKVVVYSDDTEKNIDYTLGSLNKALEYNKKIFLIEDATHRYIIKLIDEWRDKERNGYFHQDAIRNIDKVTEIRNKAIVLYFLLLGSCLLKNDKGE